MKVVENSASRLVLKEGALTVRIIGGILLVGGIAVVIAGTQSKKGAATLYGIGAIMFVAGIAMGVFTKSDTVVADKDSKQLTVTFKSLRNRAGQSQTVAFSDIAGVQVQQSYSQQYVGNNAGMNNPGGISFGTNGMGMNGMNGRGGTQTMLRSNLLVQLRDGTTITLASEQHQANGGIGINRQTLATRGKLLADAVGVPFDEAGGATAMTTREAFQNPVASPESFTAPAPAASAPVAASPVSPVIPLQTVAPQAGGTVSPTPPTDPPVAPTVG